MYAFTFWFKFTMPIHRYPGIWMKQLKKRLDTKKQNKKLATSTAFDTLGCRQCSSLPPAWIHAISMVSKHCGYCECSPPMIEKDVCLPGREGSGVHRGLGEANLIEPV